MRSINQIAQDDGDTSANEVARIKARERSIRDAWNRIAYNEGAGACTAERIARETDLPVHYVIDICGRSGHILASADPDPAETPRIGDLDIGAPEPFCACGRRMSHCDGSRAGCTIPSRWRR